MYIRGTFCKCWLADDQSRWIPLLTQCQLGYHFYNPNAVSKRDGLVYKIHDIQLFMQQSVNRNHISPFSFHWQRHPVEGIYLLGTDWKGDCSIRASNEIRYFAAHGLPIYKVQMDLLVLKLFLNDPTSRLVSLIQKTRGRKGHFNILRSHLKSLIATFLAPQNMKQMDQARSSLHLKTCEA